MQFYPNNHTVLAVKKKKKKQVYNLFSCIHHGPTLCMTHIFEMEITQNIQYLSLDAVYHRLKESARKEGEQNWKVGKLVFYLLRKSIKIEKSFWSHNWLLFFFLFFSPSISCWVIQQDAGNYSHLGWQQEGREDVQIVRTWQVRQLDAIGNIQRHYSLFSSLLSLFPMFLSSPGHSAGMHHKHAFQIRLEWGLEVGAKWFTYVDQRVASCRCSWLKFVRPRIQGVM